MFSKVAAFVLCLSTSVLASDVTFSESTSGSAPSSTGQFESTHQEARACNKAGDHECSKKLYKWLASVGDPKGQWMLGTMYFAGIGGVEQNFELSVFWIRQAAEQGYAMAQTQLGWHYLKGVGVEKNASEVIRWYRRAADQNDEIGLAMMGAIHSDGVLVPQDYGEAALWYAQGVIQGHEDAIENFAQVIEKLPRLEISKPVINIRTRPSTDSEIRLQAKQGETVYQLKSDGKWIMVYYENVESDNYLIGYVASFLVR